MPEQSTPTAAAPAVHPLINPHHFLGWVFIIDDDAGHPRYASQPRNRWEGIRFPHCYFDGAELEFPEPVLLIRAQVIAEFVEQWAKNSQGFHGTPRFLPYGFNHLVARSYPLELSQLPSDTPEPWSGMSIENPTNLKETVIQAEGRA